MFPVHCSPNSRPNLLSIRFRVCRGQLDGAASPNYPTANYAAKPSAPPAQLLFEAWPNLIHARTWIAWFGDLQNAAAYAQLLARLQLLEIHIADGDVFFHSSRFDAQQVQRFNVHQRYLAPTRRTPVNTPLQSLVSNGLRFLDLLHRKAMNQAHVQMQNLTHY